MVAALLAAMALLGLVTVPRRVALIRLVAAVVAAVQWPALTPAAHQAAHREAVAAQTVVAALLTGLVPQVDRVPRETVALDWQAVVRAMVLVLAAVVLVADREPVVTAPADSAVARAAAAVWPAETDQAAAAAAAEQV